MSAFVTNRTIRRAYRKRLLPMVEQCLLGRAVPVAVHYPRQKLDRQAASEILACFEGQTWLNDYTLDELLSLWDQRVRDQQVSIGNFVEYLYEEQVAYDQNRLEGNDDPALTASSLYEKRLALLATLYIAGYLPKYEPESLLELV